MIKEVNMSELTQFLDEKSKYIQASEDKNPFFYVFVAKMMLDGKKEEEIKASSKLKNVMKEIKKFLRKIDNNDVKHIASVYSPNEIVKILKESKTIDKKEIKELFDKFKDVISSEKEKFTQVIDLDDAFSTLYSSEAFEEFFK
jgi:predicted MPP superfamily phosphohydrolase